MQTVRDRRWWDRGIEGGNGADLEIIVHNFLPHDELDTMTFFSKFFDVLHNPAHRQRPGKQLNIHVQNF